MGATRLDNHLVKVPDMQGWMSPRLGIRFALSEETLTIYGPDGDRFLTPVELAQQRDQARQRADQEQQRAERLAARLRELGVDPDEL